MAMYYVQRAITPKVGKLDLQFIGFACRLIVLYICVKFREYLLKDFSTYRVDTKRW